MIKLIVGLVDLKDWKFCLFLGMEIKIFEKFGVKLIVMDFIEIFIVFEIGIIDGVDVFGIVNNVGFGFYDIGKYINFLGFYFMLFDYFVCNKFVWDVMLEVYCWIMLVVMEFLVL